MVAFQYGSIVFFNFGDDEEEEALSAVRKFCTDEFRETRKDGNSFTAHYFFISFMAPFWLVIVSQSSVVPIVLGDLKFFRPFNEAVLK